MHFFAPQSTLTLFSINETHYDLSLMYAVEVTSPDTGKAKAKTPSKTPAKAAARGRSTTPSKRKGGKNEDLGTFQSPDGGERRSSRLRTKTPRKTDDDF